jgi:membrane-associated phospholipid phosphatase
MSLAIFGESKYSYNLTRDLIISSVSLTVSVAPFFIDTAPKDISFHKDTVNFFDRRFMFPYNKKADLFGDIGIYGLLFLPALSLAGNKAGLHAVATYSIMYAESLLLTYGTTEILKKATVRNRPYTYYDGIHLKEKHDFYKSFPSRHAAFAFMSAGFLSSTFYTEYPHSPWKLPITGISYLFATGISLSRISSGNHFVTDVLGGMAIGSLYGYLIPFLHLRKSEKKYSFNPTVNGFVFSYTF